MPVKHCPQPGQAALAQEIAALEGLTPDMLRQEWYRLYSSTPPQLTKDLLIRGLAWRLQERCLGGHSNAVLKTLSQLSPGAPKRARGKLKAGTRLVRSWQGVTHAVLVSETGFVFEEKHYGSLSAIAAHITGTRWSGPRFFGLKALP